MILSLPSSDQGEKTTAESVTSSHQAKLARLMWAAYQGTVDYDGETLEEATKEIEHTFEGGYGALLSDCSFVISDESDQLLISAILFSAVIEDEIEPEHECLYKGDNDEKIVSEDQIYESSPFACVFCLTNFDSELELENHIGSHSAMFRTHVAFKTMNLCRPITLE